MSRTSALRIVCLVFLAGILVRLPNILRPVSKHHEFMSALILINLESWREGGGGDQFHYIPVLNFQHPGDKYYETSEYVNSRHDRWYLSLGPAWYIIPYFVYQLFHLPPSPIYLRIINLVFGLWAVLLFFKFCERMVLPDRPGSYEQIALAGSLFAFSPAMLWYTGNGYTHTTLVLPFILAFLYLVLAMVSNLQKVNFSRLLLLYVLVILLVYIDWLVLFVCIFTALFLARKPRTPGKPAWIIITLAAAACTGIALLFIQFSSQDGPAAVLAYWKSRFLFRSFANEQVSFPRMAFHLVFFHGMSAFLPQVLIIVISWMILRFRKSPIRFSGTERFFLLTYGLAVVMYNAILMEWSYEHEFSLMPWAPLLAYAGGRLLAEFRNRKMMLFISGCYLLLTIAQYYYINRPGQASRDGMAYNTFELSGEHIRNIPPDYKIYSPIERPAPMIEYYAGRNITIAPSYEAAREDMTRLGITKAVWVEQDQYKLITIVPVNR
jgi:hypothetical protein